MSQTTTAEIGARAVVHAEARRLSAAGVLSKIIFASLVSLIIFTAIPYGASQAWWKAFFVCVVFTLAILWLVEGFISDSWLRDSWPLALPLACLALFAFLQTLPFGNKSGNPTGINFATWNAISADPYQTRFFA